MILIDANLLLYAYHAASPAHEQARSWLESTLSSPTPVRLAWTAVLAFLRLTTSPRIFERPLSMSEAEAAVSTWLALPSVGTLEPGERHWEVLSGLLRSEQVSGALVMDAALAALAIEHGAILCTTDRDFSRFRGLRVENPLADDSLERGLLSPGRAGKR